MTRHRLHFAVRTDRGLVRQTNEDAQDVRPDTRLVVVADGMGGYNAGEVASQLAVELVTQFLDEGLRAGIGEDACLELGVQAISIANGAICQAASQVPELSGMGTTLVLGAFLEGSLVFVWVGDSRLYRLRGGKLELLTRDHTLVQELVDQGAFPRVEDAVRAGVGENILTRALGSSESFEAGRGATPLCEGDLYLFCTDGLNHMVDDEAIRSTLVDHDDGIDGCADRLLERACAAGGIDNITLVLGKVSASGA